MADLQKKLKLIAELDSGKLKRQVSDLKKEIDKLTIKGEDISAFTKSADVLRDAAKELKEAVNQFRRLPPQRINQVSGQGGSATPPGVARPRRASRAAEEVREVFDPDARRGRGRRVRLKGQEVYSPETQSVYKDQRQRLEAERRYRLKTEEMIEKRQEQAARRTRQQEIREQRAQERQQEQRAKGRIVAAGRFAGIDLPVGRELVESMNLEGGFRGLGTTRGRYRAARRSGIGRGASRFLAGPAVGLAGAGVGAVAGGALMGDALSSFRQIRSARAEREQLLGMGAAGGDFLGAQVEQTGREDLLSRIGGGARGGASGFISGALKGAALGAGAGSFIPGVGTVVGGIGGALAGGLGGAGLGIFSGMEEAGMEEGSTRRAETQRALQGLSTARGLRRPRMGAQRGGGISGDRLTALQGIGAFGGFGAQETMQQFLQSRQMLGNEAAGQLLPGMQNLFNQTGIDVGAQAQAADVFTGAQGGQSFRQGANQTQEIIKKGMMAGLDASRTGKFLESTVSFVTQTQGMGNIDVSGVAGRLGGFAAGSAGGGDISSTNLRQAQQLASIERQESFSTGGLGGVGNILGVQEALGDQLSPGRMLAAMRISANATTEDIQEILGVDEDTAKRLQQAKQDTQGRGLEALGIDPLSDLGIALGAGGRNITAEEQLGARRGVGGRLREDDVMLPPSVAATEEGRSLQQDARVEQQNFIRGMDLMNSETNRLQESFKDLRDELEKSIRKLGEYTGMAVSRQSGGG